MIKTLIILDWDDTLFPTSWVVKNNINVLNVANLRLFNKLDIILFKFLNNLTKCGKVIIVTNAMKRWIYMSSYILPQTNQLIKKNINVFSARDICKDYYQDMSHWKLIVFKYLAQRFQPNSIISIGDAEYEFNALINLYDNKKVLKTIRLISDPTFESLIDQLYVLDNSIYKICTKNKHMDLLFKSKN